MKYIVGNWKVYPRTLAEAKEIIAEVKKTCRGASKKGVQPIICPPPVFFSLLAEKPGELLFGAQTCSPVVEGAHTGEVSPIQLFSAGASVVILGHSERRALGESDADVAVRAQVAVKVGLTVVLCVGEKERDRDGRYFMEVARQLEASLDGFPEQKTAHLMIAYEPVWAIGEHAENAASPRDHQEMSMLIRRTLSERFGKQKGFNIPILYGGSVSAKNAGGFLDIGADGLLVGRASVRPAEFSAIVRQALECHV